MFTSKTKRIEAATSAVRSAPATNNIGTVSSTNPARIKSTDRCVLIASNSNDRNRKLKMIYSSATIPVVKSSDMIKNPRISRTSTKLKCTRIIPHWIFAEMKKQSGRRNREMGINALISTMCA